MARLEIAVVGFFFACWIVVLLSLAGLVPLAGHLPLSLYAYYSLAAGLGWISGNVYVVRRRSLEGAQRRRAFVLYFIGPLGLTSLLRAMAPASAQAVAPFVPLYAVGVFTIFFLVPLILKPPTPRLPRIGK